MTKRFPALVLSNDVLVVFYDESELRMATEQALKNRYFNTLEYIDTKGNTFRIAAFETVKEPFWKRPKTPLGRGISAGWRRSWRAR